MIRKSFAICGAWLVIASTIVSGKSLSQATTTFPQVQREFRGVWVATVANIDWPSTRGLSVEQQKAELIAILERLRQINMNAVILQVRPACDALYDSKLEPWSPFLTGTMGKAPEPFYDPLAFAVEQCHRRGLELHAWFNPYRALHPAYEGPVAPNHISQTRPDLVVKYGKYLWLDPGKGDVQQYTYDVIMDVVRRYDIDGVHMDDYFYPYPETDKQTKKEIDFPDAETYQAYLRSGGTLAKADWRRQNVNTLIERLYKGIKAEKPWVKFGLSPFGIWKPGHPSQIKGFSQYDKLYADARLWLKNGWVDYFTPQLYWRIAPPEQSYVALLTWWQEQNTKRRHLWPGLYTGRLMEKNPKGWDPEEIIAQIQWSRLLAVPSGQVHFSAAVFMKNSMKINDYLTTPGGVYSRPALVPASPWLDRTPPAPPRLEWRREGERVRLVWRPADGADVWQWVLCSKRGDEWSTDILPGNVTEHVFEATAEKPLPTAAALTALDRCGNESRRVMVQLDGSGRRSPEKQ